MPELEPETYTDDPQTYLFPGGNGNRQDANPTTAAECVAWLNAADISQLFGEITPDGAAYIVYPKRNTMNKFATFRYRRATGDATAILCGAVIWTTDPHLITSCTRARVIGNASPRYGAPDPPPPARTPTPTTGTGNRWQEQKQTGNRGRFGSVPTGAQSATTSRPSRPPLSTYIMDNDEAAAKIVSAFGGGGMMGSACTIALGVQFMGGVTSQLIAAAVAAVVVFAVGFRAGLGMEATT